MEGELSCILFLKLLNSEDKEINVRYLFNYTDFHQITAPSFACSLEQAVGIRTINCYTFNSDPVFHI